MQWRLLGPFEVDRDGEVVPLGSRKQRALLAVLALDANRPVSTDQLIEAVWGDDLPENPANTVRTYVSRLRSVLGDEAIERRGEGYALVVDPDDLDVARFRSLVAVGRRLNENGRVRRSAVVLQEALDLWRGPLLADFAFESFTQMPAARLDEERLEAVADLLSLRSELGESGAVASEVEALIAEHPFRERLRAVHMLALYRAGRQAEALRAFRDTQRVFGDELGIEPSPELRDLEERILLHDPGLAARQHGSPVAPELPARFASFVGREDLLSELASEVRSHRLVSLVGPGGVGKTSLAIELGRRVAPEFDDGVVLAELTGIEDGRRVPFAVAEAMTVQIGDDWERVAASRDVLLILDNAEHVLDGVVACLGALLTGGESMHVVVTSRTPLRIPGERVREVPTLPVAGADASASRLFRERAVIELLDEDLVERIVTAVDGLPLAIELVAAQTRAWSLSELLDSIRSERMLTFTANTIDRRHATMVSALRWSLDLLDEPARVAFASLSVFRAPFSLADAAAVSGVGESAIRSFVDGSLLIRRGERLQLLAPVREIAVAMLEERGEGDRARTRHAMHFARLVSDLAAAHGPRSRAWREQLGGHLDDIVAATLHSAATGDATTVDTLFKGIVGLSRGRSRTAFADLVDVLEPALGVLEEDPESHRWALFGFGWFQFYAEREEGLERGARLEALGVRLGDDDLVEAARFLQARMLLERREQRERVDALLSWVRDDGPEDSFVSQSLVASERVRWWNNTGRFDQAEPLIRRELARFPTGREHVLAIDHLVDLLHMTGRAEEALAILDEESKDDHFIGRAHALLAVGRTGDALEWIKYGCTFDVAHGWLTTSFCPVAHYLDVTGDARTGTWFLSRMLGGGPPRHPHHDALLASFRSALGDDFDTEWERGATMDVLALYGVAAEL